MSSSSATPSPPPTTCPKPFASRRLRRCDVIIKQMEAPGGMLLMNHSTMAYTLAAIDAGGWNYVVLQEQSQAPAFPDAQFRQGCAAGRFTTAGRLVFAGFGRQRGAAGMAVRAAIEPGSFYKHCTFGQPASRVDCL